MSFSPSTDPIANISESEKHPMIRSFKRLHKAIRRDCKGAMLKMVKMEHGCQVMHSLALMFVETLLTLNTLVCQKIPHWAVECLSVH